MSKKRKKRKRGISAFEQRRQDQAALPEIGKNPPGFSKMTPAQKAKAILAQPTTGGPKAQPGESPREPLSPQARFAREQAKKSGADLFYDDEENVYREVDTTDNTWTVEEAREAAEEGSFKVQGGPALRGLPQNKAKEAEEDKLFDKATKEANENTNSRGEEVKGPSAGQFPKKIGRESPSGDDFSDAGGVGKGDPPDIAETVLTARKEYLDNAEKAGSDVSEARKQLFELEKEHDVKAGREDAANDGLTISQRRSKELRKFNQTSAADKLDSKIRAKKRNSIRQPKGTKSAKRKGLAQHGPKNPKGGFGNWRRQRRDPRTGRWV